MVTPKALRNALKCDRAAAAVEAAILFPVLALLMIGACDFSLVLYTQNAVQSAASTVTRQVAINYLEPQNAQAVISQSIPQWAAPFVSAAVTQTSPGSPSTNIITISVSLPAGKATPLNLFVTSLAGSWVLKTSVSMKQEARV